MRSKKAAFALGAALLLGPSLTACNLSSPPTCDAMTAGGRGGSSGKSGGSKSKPKTQTKPRTVSGGGGYHSDDCD